MFHGLSKEPTAFGTPGGSFALRGLPLRRLPYGAHFFSLDGHLVSSVEGLSTETEAFCSMGSSSIAKGGAIKLGDQ